MSQSIESNQDNQLSARRKVMAVVGLASAIGTGGVIAGVSMEAHAATNELTANTVCRPDVAEDSIDLFNNTANDFLDAVITTYDASGNQVTNDTGDTGDFDNDSGGYEFSLSNSIIGGKVILNVTGKNIATQAAVPGDSETVEIDNFCASEEATPSPSSSTSPTESASATPSASATASPSASPTKSSTPSTSPSASPTKTMSPSPSTSPSAITSPTPSATVTYTAPAVTPTTEAPAPVQTTEAPQPVPAPVETTVVPAPIHSSAPTQEKVPGAGHNTSPSAADATLKKAHLKEGTDYLLVNGKFQKINASTFKKAGYHLVLKAFTQDKKVKGKLTEPSISGSKLAVNGKANELFVLVKGK